MQDFLNKKLPAAYATFIKAVNQHASTLEQCTVLEIQQQLQALRALLYAHGFESELLIKAFALLTVLSDKVLNMRPYNTQLLAARIMLDGKMAEMATGEGKTLASSLAAIVAAMAGKSVHLITANDYLAKRDAEKIKPLSQALGVTVGTVISDTALNARQQAYDNAIVFCTAKELAFDFLRDSLHTKQHKSELHHHIAAFNTHEKTTVLKGLDCAFIDEADTVLIDEASTPLILSAEAEDSGQISNYKQALSIAKTLETEHYQCNIAHQKAELTEAGHDSLAKHTQALKGVWRHAVYRAELVCTALAALHIYHRNQHYLVDNDEVKIIDQLTGRVAEGRRWSNGLHQMIALKEQLTPAADLVTQAQITFQSFFTQYALLGGMSGTLMEAKKELNKVYGLTIHPIPLHQPSQLNMLAKTLFSNKEHLDQQLLREVKQVHETGRPILIGTDSVEDSEQLSTLLKQQQLSHKTLNARQNLLEAKIIEAAGKQHAITIATNMAGRGVDIPVHPEVTNLGGLHIISCQNNDSNRVDRQLFGRTARHGQPGSVSIYFYLEAHGYSKMTQKIINKLIPVNGLKKPQWLINFLYQHIKIATENKKQLLRAALMAQESENNKKQFSV